MWPVGQVVRVKRIADMSPRERARLRAECERVIGRANAEIAAKRRVIAEAMDEIAALEDRKRAAEESIGNLS